MGVKDFLTILQTFTTFGTLCMMLYGLKLFLRKPQDSLVQRVTELEVKVKEHEDSLNSGNDRFREQNDRFREQKKTNALIINSLVALIEFEVDYCIHHGDEKISPRLDKTKIDLQSYLAEK